MDDASNPFAPLTPAELAEAARQGAQTEAGSGAPPTCPPADAESGALAAARLYGRKPDGLWRYATAEDETAFYAARWNEADGKKTFRPVSWVAGDGWQLVAWPDHRPLFNLPDLVSKPKAPVVVCEGEKAAEAAAAIFPNSIATTSSGGAGAAARTDWTPLAGRSLSIWPDNDAAGEKYAREVAAILAALDCSVSIVDAKALAAIDPAGGAREPRDKWDAADARAEWPDLAAPRETAVGLRKAFDLGPAFVSYGPYDMTANGLHVEVEKGRADNRMKASEWVAASFEILGACRDPHGRAWGKYLRWRDGDGRAHVQHVTDAALQGDPAPVCASLVDGGLRINRSQQRAFASYLSGAPVKGRVTIILRTGWHEVGGQSVFVLPAATVGPRGSETVILDGAAHGPYEASGSIEDWRDGPAALASGHVLPVLAISAALAGPLLHLAGAEGGGVHFHGQSSRGKTTLLQMAASVWGRGATPGYVRTWRATANGLEGAAAGATDTALILDELGQVDGRELAGALYALANGAGKARAMRDGALREPRSWRVLTISSGEVPIDAKLAEDRGKKTRTGQLVRMLDIPAVRASGVFDHAGPDGDAAAFAKRCKLAAAASFGTAGPEFVRRLIADDVRGADVRAMVSDFVAKEVPAGADGQVDRAAHRLGIIAAAGALATELGLTGWREGEAIGAAAWALIRWIDGRGGTEPAEVPQAVEAVRRLIEAHGEARFDNLDDSDAKPVNARLGWRKGAGAEREWWIPPQSWKSEFCAGHEPQFVARVLAERGMLRRQSGNVLQCTVNIGGAQRVRAYVLTAAILDGGDDAG